MSQDTSYSRHIWSHLFRHLCGLVSKLQDVNRLQTCQLTHKAAVLLQSGVMEGSSTLHVHSAVHF